MLSGKAFNNGKGYAQNHLKSNDYYEKGKTVNGYWLGRACQNFGVTEGAKVTDEEFEALRSNHNPISGEQLTLRNNTIRVKTLSIENEVVMETVSNRRSFYDFTFSAPKSFSVMAVTLDDSRIRDWHDKAIRKAVKELEVYTSRQDHSYSDIERTGGFCAAHFKHDANRSLEPQLHDHVVIFNATPSKNGSSYAIEFGEFYKRCKYITAVYRDELAKLAGEGGYKIEIDEQGAPQILNTKDIVKHFSGRTRIIEEHVKNIEDEIGTVLSNSQKKLISFATRGFDEDKFAKLYENNDYGKSWSKETYFSEYLKLIGMSSNSGLIEATTPDVIENQKKSLSEEQLKRLEAMLSISQKLEMEIRNGANKLKSPALLLDSMEFSRKHNFERKSVVKDYEYFTSVLSHSLGRGTNLDRMKNYLQYQLEDNQLIKIKDEIATREHLEQELNIIDWVKEGENKFSNIQIEEFFPSELLNREQRNAVTELVLSKDQFNALIGKAGTGKTFTVSEIVRANIESGYNVLLCAPSNGARDVLKEDGRKIKNEYKQPLTAKPFESAVSLQKLLVNEKLQNSVNRNSLIILDEAGMASLKQLNELAKIAREKSWRILHVGDVKQHISVEAGDGFRIELKYSNIKRCQLKRIQRQKRTAMKGKYRQIALDLAFGRIVEAFNSLDNLGAIIEVKNYDMYKALADEYIKYYENNKSVVVVNSTHKENFLASEAIREKMKERGLITNEQKVKINIPLSWTAAEKLELNKYKPGMILEFISGKNKGTGWTVKSIDVSKGLKCISIDGEKIFIPKAELNSFDVCTSKEIMLGIGDRIMIRTGEKNRTGELTNGEILQVKGFDKSGNIIAENNKLITSRKIAYGYASTSHKAQGKTTEAVLIGFDRFSVRFADQKTAYVAGTRGVSEMKIFCENKLDLLKIDTKTGDRKSALELIEEASIHDRKISDTQKVRQQRINKMRTDISNKRKSGIVIALTEFSLKLKSKLNKFLGYSNEKNNTVNLSRKLDKQYKTTNQESFHISY